MYLRSKLPEQKLHILPDLQGLITWLETQNPATTYDWYDIKGCVVCRFYDSIGMERSHVRSLDAAFSSIDEYYMFGHTKPWTYGAALARGRMLLLQREG